MCHIVRAYFSTPTTVGMFKGMRVAEHACNSRVKASGIYARHAMMKEEDSDMACIHNRNIAALVQLHPQWNPGPHQVRLT